MYGISDKADRRQFWNDDAPCKKFDMQRRLQHSSYVVSSIHSFLRETEHTIAVAIPSLVMKQAAELDVASTLTYNQSDEIIHVLEEEPSAGLRRRQPADEHKDQTRPRCFHQSWPSTSIMLTSLVE